MPSDTALATFQPFVCETAEQPVCMCVGESDCAGGVRGCDKFHDSLTPAGTACTDPSTDEGGVGVGSLPKNATSTFSSGAPPRVVRWVVNNAVLPLGCCC